MSTTNAILTSMSLTDAWENQSLKSSIKEYKKALDSVNSDYAEELLLSKIVTEQLKILKPDSLIFLAVVEKEIRAQARAALARTHSFKSVKNLKLNLASILQQKVDEYEEIKKNEKYRIEIEQIQPIKRFLGLGKIVGYRFFQLKFDSESEAANFKIAVLADLARSTIHNPFSLNFA